MCLSLRTEDHACGLARLTFVNLLDADQVLHLVEDLVRVARLMLHGLHLVAFDRARKQVDREHLVRERKRVLRADVRTAAAFDAVSWEK